MLVDPELARAVTHFEVEADDDFSTHRPLAVQTQTDTASMKKQKYMKP